MRNRNNQPRRSFSDMVVQPRPHAKLFVSVDDEQAIEVLYRKQLMRKRVRRVARVAIIATKHNVTARQRSLALQKQQLLNNLRLLRTNQYRIAATFCLVISVVSVITPVFTEATDTRPIELDNSVKALIGDSRDDTKQYLQYDANRKVYTFEPKQQDKGDYEHTGRNTDAYNLSLSKNADDGITLTDNKSKVDITLKPEFFTASARRSTGDQIVYKSGRTQLIYSLKYNGLKEDIIIPEEKGSTATYSFKLTLPSGVEARLDSDGNIGIYSGDTSLYGDISYGSDEDRAKVEKARENATKTNLLTTIPFPIIRDSTGKEYSNLAKFELGQKVHKTVKTATGNENKLEYTLSLKAHGLSDLQYPISIDPTLQVTSSADFDGVQDQGGAQIDYTNNLIKRASITGGILNTWTTNTIHLPYSGTSSNIDIANGYVYSTSGGATVYSAQIDMSTGSVGTFTSTGIVPLSGAGDAVISNGYMYMYGTNWQYAKILPNGKLSAFTATTAHSQARSNYSIAASNGYIYLTGGYYQSGCPLTCTDNYLNTVQYAKQNADGSLSAWATTTPFATPRLNHSVKAYGDYLYIIGGWDNVNGDTSAFKTVQYAKQNTNGTLSAWSTTSVLTTARVTPAVTFLNGYLYVIASFDAVATVEYAQVNNDGTLGSLALTTSINGTGRGGACAQTYNGKIYIGGGLSNGGSNSYDEIQYVTPQSAGVATPWKTTTSIPAGSWAASGIATNGYLYYIGGMTNDCTFPGCTGRTTVYYAPINADGSIGSWGTTTAFPVGIAGQRMVATAGYMYLIGGATTCFADATLGFYCTGSTAVYYSAIAANGTLGTWTSTTAFTNGRYHMAVGIYGGEYLYIAGGATSSGSTTTYYNDTQFAPINSDGSVGTWTSTATLPRTLATEGMTISGQYAYLAGGAGTPSPVYYAAINPTNGTLGAWKTTTSITTYSGYTVLYASKGYLYTYSSTSNTTGDPLQYAPINADGSVGTWTALNSYTNKRYQSSGAFYNDRIYVMSGSTSTSISGFYTDVQYTTINHGGAGVLNAWTNSSKSISTAHTRGGLVALNGYLYALSGCSTNTNSCTALTGTVEYTAINSDGTLAGWANTTASVTPRQGASYYAYNGRIYAQGGQSNATGTYTRSIEFATPAGNGDITAWTPNSINTPTDEGYGGVVVYNGYAYRVGGINGIGNGTNVSSAPIDDSTGQVGNWTSLNSTNIAHQSHGLTMYKNYIYAVSGLHTSAVEFASINSDHSLSSWKLTTGTNLQRQEVGAFASNGFLCVVSGFNDNLNRVTSSECAPILTNGSVDTWKLTGYVNNRTAGHEITTYNGIIYKVGGTDSSANPVYTAESTTFTSLTRKASFSKMYDFDLGVKPTKLIIRGNERQGTITPLYYLSTNQSTTTFDNSQSVTDAGYSTSINAITLGNSRTLSRYLFIKFTIDDTQAVTYPDIGNESTITDFDMYYVSNPGTRLRGGRTFTNGADRGLDAQPQ